MKHLTGPVFEEGDLAAVKSTRLSKFELNDRLGLDGLSEDDTFALKALTDSLKAILYETGVLPEIAENNYWVAVFVEDVHREAQPDEFAVRKRNIALNIPTQVDIEKIREVIEKQALKSALELVEKGHIQQGDLHAAIHNLRIGLGYRLRSNLRRLKTRPLVRKHMGVSVQKQEDREYIDFLSLRAVAGNVASNLSVVCPLGDMTNINAQKDLGINMFLTESGLIDPELIFTPAFTSLVKECFGDAKAVYRDIMHRVSSLTLKHATTLRDEFGVKSITAIDINSTLLNKHPYDLIQLLFSGKLSPVHANEVQSSIVLAYKLLQYRLHPSNEASKGKEEYLSKAVDQLCERDVNGDPVFYEGECNIYEYLEDTERPYGYFADTEMKYKHALRRIEIDDFEDIPEVKNVYLDDVSRKDSTAVLMKSFSDKYPSLEPEDLHDQLRTRIILWGVKSSDFDHDSPKRARYKEYLTALGKQTIKNLGLEYSNKPVKDLQLGEAILNDSKLDSGPFRKFTIYAKTKDGVYIEVQIIPFDTLMIDKATNSPMKHDKYKLARKPEVGRHVIAYTQYPEAHLAMDIEERNNNRSRTLAIEALVRDIGDIKVGTCGEKVLV